MTEYSWVNVKRDAIKAFGDELPSAQTEEDILVAFEQQPAAVVAEIASVAEDKRRRGDIRSGWAVLRARVVTAGSAVDRVVSDRTERDAAVRRVAHWMNNAGLYFDRETEVIDEVEMMLGPFASDEDLVAQFRRLWTEVRPRGERAELESAVYQERLRLQREGRSRSKRSPVVRRAVMAFLRGHLTRAEMDGRIALELALVRWEGGRYA